MGRWALRMETRSPQTREARKSAQTEATGALRHFGLRFYGALAEADPSVRRRSDAQAFTPNTAELRMIYEHEFARRLSPQVMSKRAYQALIKKRREDVKYSSIFDRFRQLFSF